MDYRLSVDRQHVLQGLKLRKKTVRRVHRSDRAVLSFDGSYLAVEANNITFVAHAIGAWPGNAIVNATLVDALAAAPPAEDPIIVTCDGVHLQFGPLKVACKWQPVSAIVLERPRQEEWIEALALRYTLPRARINAEGRRGEVDAAERKLRALVRRIAKSLAPMGVTAADVETLVERRLAERYAPNG
jgi:hypothetical protein